MDWQADECTVFAVVIRPSIVLIIFTPPKTHDTPPRGWTRAEAAINGYTHPGTTALAAAAPGSLGPRQRDLPHLELRLSRAAALRCACLMGAHALAAAALGNCTAVALHIL